MINRIEKLYLDSPEFWWVYPCNWCDYILIDDIPEYQDFFCHWIKLDEFGKVNVKNWKAEIEMLNIIKK